jgi:hypothetical protein
MEGESRIYENPIRKMIFGSTKPTEQTVFNPLDANHGKKMKLIPLRRRVFATVDKLVQEQHRTEEEGIIGRR